MLLKDVPTGSINVGSGGPGHSDRSHGFQPLATTRPARRIVRIWSGVLIWNRLRPNTSVLGIKCGENALTHLVDLADSIHRDKDAGRTVVLQQRLSLGGVDLHPVTDSFLVVVSASLNLSTLQQTLSEQLGIDVKADDGVKPLAMLFEVGVKGLDLVHIAG